ncbi:hypothetical protein OEZ85_001247 [Tetradesmus obliquus]|uniref:Aspartate aminotransferase n=1 Tax=Tetradesmus obliquus TaxID=3088 RepID=A0ABY8UNJ7_TETOB|nr:hypothetical protein OEZ85_001247 [Tetradesmus obliquus]
MNQDAVASNRLAILSRHLCAEQQGSVWAGVPQAPPDGILGITEAFKADGDSRKLNLGVGAYRTEEGQPLVLSAVRQAEQRLVADGSRNKEYQPMGGDATFCQLSRRLAFGAECPASAAGRIATVQTLSGTGALRVGAEFLKKHYAVKVVYLPDPTWANHGNIFGNAAGLELRKYRYFDSQTRGLDYQGLLSDLGAAPEGAVVVLHACAHNPTGVDPTPEQWQGILRVVQQRRLLPFFDSAYQGFASGDLDKDAAALRMFTSAGLELLLAQSYAKNMGLYGERVGAISVVSHCADAAKRVHSQLCAVVRPMYSSPPIHGAAIVVKVLSDPQLFGLWRQELAGMSRRIQAMRTALKQALIEVRCPGNWDHITAQIGMFSYTGLTKAQCQNMTNKWHVYMTMDGRISMAGLSGARARYMAEAIKDSVLSC